MIQRLLFIAALLVTLIGCVSGDYEETFLEDNVWSVNDQEGVALRIANEQLELSLTYPQTMYWSTAGRRDLFDGTFAVTGKPLAGDSEVGYGLVIQADAPAERLTYFMVTADGSYTVGRCTESCNEATRVRLTDPVWIESDAINTGFDVTNRLHIEVAGRESTMYINDVAIATIDGPVPEESDIGVIMQTFTSSATVAFDDISFIGAEEE